MRKFLLIIALVVLVGEAAWQVYAADRPQPDQTQLSELLESATPLPGVSPSPTPISAVLDYNSRLVSFTLLKTVDRPRIEAAQISFLSQALPTEVEQVAIYRLEYEIVGRDGDWKPIKALVYLPLPTHQRPLYVFGSGTTGIVDWCAPSLEDLAKDNLGNYENHMIAQAAAGYVSVFPDYEGFNNPEAVQAYFIVESEAKVMLGAIRSLYQLDTEPVLKDSINFEQVFVSGYSQGGHAALSAAQAWQHLPAGVHLQGVLQFAGAADVEALFYESPHLAAYLTESFVAYYQPDLLATQVLQDQWLQEMKRNNERLCVNAAYRYFPRDPRGMYTSAFLDAVTTSAWPETLRNWQTAIYQNIPLENLPQVPYLSVQGETDPIVTARTQHRNLQKMCQQGYQVTYEQYPGVNHFQIRQAGFLLGDQWMRQVLAGESVRNNCQ